MDQRHRILGAANPEEVLKVICGRDEICDIVELGFDGELETLESVCREMDRPPRMDCVVIYHH
jgi:hypothetical protein